MDLNAVPPGSTDASRPPNWGFVAAGALLALSLFYFFAFRDPMIFVMSGVAAGLLLLVSLLRAPLWAWAIWGVLVVPGILMFFQYRDPMFLLMGIWWGSLFLLAAAVVTFGLRWLEGRDSSAAVQVRCRECRALNPEAAKHCHACGHAL